MTNPRFKPLIYAAAALLLVWLLAFVGWRVAAAMKVTPEKMIATLSATDLNKLDATARARRLRELAASMNRLDRDDRRRARLDAAWDKLWRDMTEEEKGQMIERTMPTGFKQMINAFEQLSEDKRRSAVTNTLARLQRMKDGDLPNRQDPDRPPMSEELQKKVITTGLKTFYAESSAQTKAELAPVLEEMQRLMESGQLFRR